MLMGDMMNTGTVIGKLKNIAIVGPDPTCILNSSNLILESILDFRKDKIEIEDNCRVLYFTNYQYSSNISLSNSRDFSFYHLHSLPIVLKEIQIDLFVYLMDNSSPSYIYQWVRDSYPGVVVMQDASMLKMELSSLFHSTDPVGVDLKMKEFYPSSSVSIGKQIVLGRSVEIYSEIFNCLNPSSEQSKSVVFENRILDQLKKSKFESKLLPICDYLEADGSKTFIKKDTSNILFLLNSPFSMSSKEVISCSGIESYRSLAYPAYFIGESDGEGLISICELEQDNINKTLLDTLDSIVLTDITSTQGIPPLLIHAMIGGKKISVPEVLSAELSFNNGILYHTRKSTIPEILYSLKCNETTSGFVLASRFASDLINLLSDSFSKNTQKKGDVFKNRKDILFRVLDRIDSEDQVVKEELFIQKKELQKNLILSANFRELFEYVQD